MRSIGQIKRLVVNGRWYEDREPRRQTIAERSKQKLILATETEPE